MIVLPTTRCWRCSALVGRLVTGSLWDNDGHGVPVLISNGLGTPHDAWPDINRRTDTYRVMTWDHRGLGGSERPADESRIHISDHTDDLFAVMDSYGVDRAVVIGWSAGVNIAFEAAARQPPRIAGVLAVGGVPGGTFEALLHPLPGFLRPRAGRVGSHLMRYLGPVLNPTGRRIARFARAWVRPTRRSNVGPRRHSRPNPR